MMPGAAAAVKALAMAAAEAWNAKTIVHDPGAFHDPDWCQVVLASALCTRSTFSSLARTDGHTTSLGRSHQLGLTAVEISASVSKHHSRVFLQAGERRQEATGTQQRQRPRQPRRRAERQPQEGLLAVRLCFLHFEGGRLSRLALRNLVCILCCATWQTKTAQ